MYFITDDIRMLYRKLLIPSLTGAVVMSIYSFVDTIVVGQSEGAAGAAAMAVIAPVYGLMVFLGLLCGIGGSVMMSVARGQGKTEKSDACFAGSVLLVCILTGIAWLAFAVFREPFFYFFGANDEILSKTVEYGRWIIGFMPVFVFTMFIAAFIRNDGAPKLVMTAVVTGGCINIFGDWFLVFPMKMEMTGAALATVIGTSVQAVIMINYFFRKECHLRMARPRHALRGFRRVLQIGIGASLLDLGTIVIGILVNRQILYYGSTTELAVFGVIATILSLFQALFCGVGQAIQPLVSSNYGAGQKERYEKVWQYSLSTVMVMGVFFCLLGESMEKPEIVCTHSAQNNQCIGKRCPFAKANHWEVNMLNFQWTREPKNYKITEQQITITTEPHTDLWQRTYYHFRNDNAPVLQIETEEKYFSFVVKADFSGSHHRFDQCGIVMYLDSENWLKGSVEYENESFQHLGSVVTNHGYSDWATTEIPAAVKTMWYRFSRREDDYCIECSQDGEHFSQMRVCHMWEGAGKIRFGIYACSPEDSSFTAVFTDMKITECAWKAHDGQKPDEE